MSCPSSCSHKNDDDFEWAEAKNAENYADHGVTFERARLVFADPFAIGEFDDRFAYGEDRYTITGMVEGTLLFAQSAGRGRCAAPSINSDLGGG